MPSRSTTKTHNIEVRITEEEHNLEQAAAAVSGETRSEFVRRAARREAERFLASAPATSSTMKQPSGS
ncbi:MAG TPA: DUF1778 domain-containing protein [Solirubrobacteraceae bacterium]|jgi:uncharacterized protein (DUF1778 family)|nr:DUF1778 domain-containing protein [Solirubrobacteraceae bacterium]